MQPILVLSLLLGVVHLQTTSFVQFKQQMESKTINLANKMAEVYDRRCESSVKQCDIKSYDLCLGTSAKKCFSDFPKAEQCLSPGAYMSETTTIRFPNDVNTNLLSDEEKQFVCTSALLQDTFQDLDTDRNFEYAIAYVGTTLGSFRSYPSSRQLDNGQCKDYDPRYRPWYVIATSGAKNIILIIDISGSMSGNRITIAKAAAKSVINTLSNSDFIGVLAFNDEVTTLNSNRVVRATDEVKTKLGQAIDELSVDGKTNYEAALKQGFNMLDAAADDQFGAPCPEAQNLFLFLTDGDPTVGQQSINGLKNIINNRNGAHNISFFSYGLGSGIDRDILQALACEYRGIMFQIPDIGSDSELATIMRNYSVYLAEGIEVTEPVWTEPYIDAFGFGRMVTVSMPIYYTENGIRKILGVTGLDVVMSTFDQFNFADQDAIVKQLIKNAPCQKSGLTECDIEHLRPSTAKCTPANCSASSNTIGTCPYPTNSLLLEPVDEGEYKCCGLTIAAFAGIMVAVILVLIIIIVATVCIVRKRRLEAEGEEPQGEKYKEPDPKPNFNFNKY